MTNLSNALDGLLPAQLAMVMGVPVEDRDAFNHLLCHWLYEADGWREHIAGRECVPFDDEVIPRDVLVTFWAEWSLGEAYGGSELEAEVIAERARLARSLDEVLKVLARIPEHLRVYPQRPVSEMTDFFQYLAEALSHPDFEQAGPEAPPLRAVA